MNEQSNLGAFASGGATGSDDRGHGRDDSADRRDLRADERECRTCGLRYLPTDPSRARCNICLTYDGSEPDAVTD